MDQRREFVLRVLGREGSMSELCEQFGISRKTGYKWLERFKQRGATGMEDLPRRPASSPGELAEEVVCRVVRLRLANERFGAAKLRELYRRAYPDEPLPSESSFKRVIGRAGLVRPVPRRRAGQTQGRLCERFEPGAPGELWTVDFKGWWRTRGGGRCEPLTVRDAYSRYVLCADPLGDARAQTVAARMEALFREHGLPRVIRSDNGVPFASCQAPLGLSWLSARWLALGIGLDRIRPGRPQENGAHERMHRDMAHMQEAVQGSLQEQRAALELWRLHFNHERPHAALGMRMPAEVYRRSPRRYAGMPERIEYPAGWTSRRVHQTGVICVQGRQIRLSAALRGWDVGLRPAEHGGYSVRFADLTLGWIDLLAERFHAADSGQEQPR